MHINAHKLESIYHIVIFKPHTAIENNIDMMETNESDIWNQHTWISKEQVSDPIQQRTSFKLLASVSSTVPTTCSDPVGIMDWGGGGCSWVSGFGICGAARSLD